MNRIPSLLLALGTAVLVLGITLFTLTPTQDENKAYAALPTDHISLNRLLSPITVTARVSTTARDFFLPGTQPNQMADELLSPPNCIHCHADYAQFSGQEPGTESWNAWSGSMMAQAGRDPLFYAALDVANADAANSGEFCLRCHLPRGWLEGRSSAPDGSEMTEDDLEGVQCLVCHRLVDPDHTPDNPTRDLEVLSAITSPVTTVGSASMIVDPEDYRRGPLLITDVLDFDPHEVLGFKDTLQSPYHTEAAFCGVCHDIGNPVFSWDETSQSYQLNPLDTPGDPALAFPVERTYSEWLLSDYNSPEGIYAPQFGGNKQYVSTCQDCHMRDITGLGGVWFGNQGENRDDVALHDMTGGNTWVPQIIPLHPVFSSTFTGDVFAEARAEALITGTLRARYMLQNGASMTVTRSGEQIAVMVVNQTGHKLPTGYPEGRRMWLQVAGYDGNGSLIYSSGTYDVATGILTEDPDLKLYEVQQGLTPDLAVLLGMNPGASFHFALNNSTVCDNRIPPRGYEFDAYAGMGAAPYANWQPTPDLYADGQNWDLTVYQLPTDVVTGTVRLLYQTASREYLEFLRQNNPYPGQNNGEILYDLWEMTERSRPEIMTEATFDLNTPAGDLAVYGGTAVADTHPDLCTIPTVYLPAVVQP